MNYNLFFKILLCLAIISTICIFCAKPKMHTAVLVYSSDYTIVEPKVETTVEKYLPTVSQQPQQRKKVENVVNTVKNVQNTKPEQPKTTTQIKKQTSSQTKQTQARTATKTDVTQSKKQTHAKKMTQSEEEIAWNKWRSNLQNSIMRDTQLPTVEQGTVFRFTFNVDKYGRISNVKTWSLTPSYTPIAIEYIAPVIRSYQGKSILNFPAGSERMKVEFDGKMKVASVQKYSTPQDYNDYEKIRK